MEKYGEVWRLVAGRRRSKAPRPVMGTEQSDPCAHVCMILDEAGRTERVRVRRSRRENRNSRWSSHAAAKKTRPLLSDAGEYIKGHVVRSSIVVPSRGRVEKERTREYPRTDRRGCRRTGSVRSSVSGTRSRDTRGLAWRVNDSVRLILQLQLEIAKMDEPVDASEDTGSAALSRYPPFFDLHPCSRFSQGCHRRETFYPSIVFHRIFPTYEEEVWLVVS